MAIRYPMAVGLKKGHPVTKNVTAPKHSRRRGVSIWLWVESAYSNVLYNVKTIMPKSISCMLGFFCHIVPNQVNLQEKTRTQLHKGALNKISSGVCVIKMCCWNIWWYKWVAYQNKREIEFFLFYRLSKLLFFLCAASDQTQQVCSWHDPRGVWFCSIREASHGVAESVQG